MMPRQDARRHVLEHSASAGLEAIVTRIEHRQPFAVGWGKLIGERFRAVMPLIHKLAVPLAQFNCRIHTCRNACRFKDNIGAFRCNLLELFHYVLGGTVDEVICAQFLGDLQPVLLKVDGNDDAAPMATRSHNSQSDQPAP